MSKPSALVYERIMIELLIPLFLFLATAFYLCKRLSLKKRLLIYFFLSLLLFSFQRIFTPAPTVCEVYKGSTADQLGWLENDKILAIDGFKISSLNDILYYIRSLDEDKAFQQQFSALILRDKKQINIPISLFPSEKTFFFEAIGSKQLTAMTGGLGFFCREPLLTSLPKPIVRNQNNPIYTEPTARISSIAEITNVIKIAEVDRILKMANNLSVIPLQIQFGWEKKTFHIPFSHFTSEQKEGYLFARKLALGIPDFGETLSSSKLFKWSDHGILPGIRILKIEGIDPAYYHKLKAIIKDRESFNQASINILFYKNLQNELRLQSVTFNTHPSFLGLYFMPDLVRFSAANAYSNLSSILLFPVIETYRNLIKEWPTFVHAIFRKPGFSYSWYRLPFLYFFHFDFWLFKLGQVFMILFLVETPFLFFKPSRKRSFFIYLYVFSTSLIFLIKTIWVQNAL